MIEASEGLRVEVRGKVNMPVAPKVPKVLGLDRSAERGFMDSPSGNDQKSALRGYAPTAGVSEQVVFAIVAQESALGTAGKIGNNVMQVDSGNDVSVANLSPAYKARAEELGFHDRITIRDLFPDYDTDYDSNVQAGLVILHEKIMIDGGNYIRVSKIITVVVIHSIWSMSSSVIMNTLEPVWYSVMVLPAAP